MPRGPQRTSLGESRARVLATVRAARGLPLRGDEIASEVRLSLTATRLHLDRLVADGLIRAGSEPRDRPGRPHVTYRAPAAEAVDDAAAYRLLAGVLAAQLSRSGDPKASVEAGRAWAAQIVDTPTDTPSGTTADTPSGPTTRTSAGATRPGPRPSEDAVARVMALLDDAGFDPRRTQEPAGRVVIELHRCPFLELAAERAEVVCSVHLGFVRGVLERLGESATAKVTPVLDGSAPCLVRLIPAARAPREPRGSRRREA
jgi:predicted ArsR family transcriptional regulator